MQGQTEVINSLNKVLTIQLTLINQYFLHARMLNNWGYEKLGKKAYKASIAEMKYADELIKRVLFLDGLPNLQRLNKLRIGQTISECVEADIFAHEELVVRIKDVILTCENHEDFVSREMLENILSDEEEFLDFLLTQKDLIKEIGVENYSQSQLKD